MKIAISGCGIAGTAAAKFLADDGHDVFLFEQASECKPIGAGILLQPSGQAVLRKLGIHGEVVSESAELDGLWAKQCSGKTLVRLKYQWLDSSLLGYGVHRGRLFDRLLRSARDAGAALITGFRVVEAERQSGHRVRLKSSTGEVSEDFDFVVAADGSRSLLRGGTGIATKIVDYDYAALWTTGKCEYQPGTLVQVVQNTHELVGLLPIGGGESSFFWGLPADGFNELRNQSIASWKRQVLAICPDAESMLDTIKHFDDLTFARYRHVTMQRWYNNHILFIGDAAHATSPHLGQGVNLALEDAECFAACLRQTGRFASACREYTRLRRWKLAYFQQLTRALSPFFQSQGSAKGRLRDTFLPWFPKVPIVRREMIRTLCGYKQGWIG